MNTNRNTKVGHQRNITPNFLRFKRKYKQTQENLPPNPKNRSPSIILKMLSVVTPKRADAASTSIKKEYCTSASSVATLISRKYAQYKTKVGLSRA